MEEQSQERGKTMKRWFPSFRASCLTICVLYVLLAGGILVRDLKDSMAPFNIPPQTLNSPHFQDAMFWVYLHMLVIGLMIGVLGLYAQSKRLKVQMARLLFLAHIAYTTLDFRHSDSLLGNGLYKGSASLIPAFIALAVTLLLAYLSFAPHPYTEKTPEPPNNADQNTSA